MPLKLTIGQSRKVSKDYNSQGFSVSLDAELANEAVNDPAVIHDAANRLFEFCDQLLTEQVNQHQRDRSQNKPNSRHNGNGRHGTPTRPNGNGQSDHRREEPRRLTSAQQRAITNMARRLDQDADDWAAREYDVDGVTNLTVRQASDLIDQLKREIEAAGAGSGGR